MHESGPPSPLRLGKAWHASESDGSQGFIAAELPPAWSCGKLQKALSLHSRLLQLLPLRPCPSRPALSNSGRGPLCGSAKAQLQLRTSLEQTTELLRASLSRMQMAQTAAWTLQVQTLLWRTVCISGL